MRGLLRRERDLFILAERPLWFIACWFFILIFRGLYQFTFIKNVIYKLKSLHKVVI